jgi:hypothetical protein
MLLLVVLLLLLVCSYLCITTDTVLTENLCTTTTATATTAIVHAQAVLLVQSIVDCEFFLDLTGDFAELWRLMPEMRNAIDLPTVRSSARHGSGGEDSEDSEDSMHGFIAPEVSSTHSLAVGSTVTNHSLSKECLLPRHCYQRCIMLW